MNVGEDADQGAWALDPDLTCQTGFSFVEDFGHCLLYRAEWMWYFDTNDDGQINGRDNDSNGDLHDDDDQVYTVFRTNATGGAYGASGVWVALPPTMTNVTAAAPNFSAASALYVMAGEVESGKGEPFMIVYKGVPYSMRSPEGYEVRFFQNGSNDEVYIALTNGHFAKFTKSSQAPSDYTTSAYAVASFLANRQESYFGEKAVDLDSDADDDFDGVPNVRETGRGMNPYSNDSDADGVLDGVEQRWSADTDMDGHINALDKDSDNDGIGDGTEDANRDGIWQTNETNVLRQDTDYDSLQDGTELGYTSGTADTCTSSGQSGCSQAWIAKLDVQGWTFTSPLDVDFDDDGIRDGVEDSDHNGRYDNGSETNATASDTDGDLLWDGIETGVMVPTKDTNLSVWHRDGSPFENTNPRSPDTDGDHLMDSVEDWNLDGLQTWGTNETDPGLYDSDGDGLCDGNCSSKGEDLDLNGWRDQDEEGDWTETDALANDSDVDGILDGLEVNGTYCFSNETSGCSHPALDPLSADSDGDQLRDGQETAGWRVLVYREVSMEKLDNYTVVPLPWVQDTDGDGNSDFVEFQNGSDPWKVDTDGDTFPDHSETVNGHSPTGFAEARPEISNWHLGKENRGGNLVGYGKNTVAVVSFDVVALWGVGNWWVRYGQPDLNASQEAEVKALTGMTGGQADLACSYSSTLGAVVSDEKCQRLYEIFGNSRVGPKEISGYGGGAKEIHVSAEFTMTWEEDLKDGVWVQAQVNDVYNVGVQKTLKLKSLLQVVVDILQSVAKAIAEAASFLINFMVTMVKWLFAPIVDPLVRAINGWVGQLLNGLARAAVLLEGGSDPYSDEVQSATQDVFGALFGDVFFMLVLVSFLIFVVNLILVAFSFFLPGIGILIGNVVKSLVIPLLIGVVVGEALNAVDFVSLVEDPVATLRDQRMPSARVQMGQAVLALLSGLLAFLSMAFGWSAVKQSWGSEVAGAKSVVSGASGFRAKAGAIWNLMKYLGKVILLIIGVALSFLSLLVGTIAFLSALHWAKVPGFVSLYVALFSGLISLISLAIAIIVWLPGQMKSAGTSITDVGWNGLKTLLQLGFQKEASFVLAGASLLIAGAGIVVAVICHPSKCP